MSLGPQFCPIKKDVDRARIQSDLNAGFRRMRLAYHFHPSEDKRTEEEKRFYLKKSYDPGRGNNKYLDVHQDFVQQKFDDWKAPLRIKDNMCPHMREALEELRKDKKRDIKLDDKSGCFVISDTCDYEAAALNSLEQLASVEEVLGQDNDAIKKEIEADIGEIVFDMVTSGDISQQTAEFIVSKTKEFKLARYYTNWKCHKYEPSKYEFALASVRGIVAGVGSPSEKAADFLDFVLNPGMRNLRSYLTGTKDLLVWIEKLKGQYP